MLKNIIKLENKIKLKYIFLIYFIIYYNKDINIILILYLSENLLCFIKLLNFY